MTMDIGKVKFGEYSVGNGQLGAKKKEEEKEQDVQTEAQAQGNRREWGQRERNRDERRDEAELCLKGSHEKSPLLEFV